MVYEEEIENETLTDYLKAIREFCEMKMKELTSNQGIDKVIQDAVLKKDKAQKLMLQAAIEEIKS